MALKYKIVFLGTQNVGKTTIISRFICKQIDKEYQPTIGIDFLTKTLEIEDKEIKLQIWDTAGQEKFNSIISSYARDSFIAVIVYDVCNLKSFESIDKCINDLVRVHDPDNKIKLLLVGNKSDLLEGEEEIQQALIKGKEKAAHYKGEYLQTCATDCEGGVVEIEEHFVKLIKEDLENNTERNKIIHKEIPENKKCC